MQPWALKRRDVTSWTVAIVVAMAPEVGRAQELGDDGSAEPPALSTLPGDDAAGPAGDAGDATPEPPRAPELDPADPGLVWRATGPDGARAFVDVAWDEARHLAAATSRTGELWLSTDGGFAWRPVLAAWRADVSGDEELLLDVETRMQELVEELDLPADVPLEALGDDAALVIDALQADIQDGFAVRSLEEGGEEVRPRVWIAPDGRLVVARQDGLWVSPDRGQTWRVALTEPVSSWASSRGFDVAGGTGRLWRLVAGREPEVIDLDDASEVVWDLTDTGADVVAATSGGALRSVDGLDWTERVQTEPVRVAAPDGRAGAWLLGWERGPGGSTFEVIDLAVRGDRLMRVGAGAVELSVDRGETWRAVGDPPAAPFAVAWGARDVLLATAGGLVRLVPVQRDDLAAGAPWIPVESLLAAAERRVGASPSADRLGTRGQTLMWLLPDIQLAARYGRGGGLHSGLDAGLDGARDGDLRTSVQLVWRPPVGNLIAANAYVATDTDGTPQVYMGAMDSFMGLGRIERRAAMHRQDVANEIVEAWRRRRDLVREIDTPRPGRTVHDVVTLRLRVAEIEAWLDVLTDGAVRRFSEGRAGGGR